MSNIARNHHYVPQFYLKAFLDSSLPNEQLHVIDKVDRRHFVTSPRNIAAQRDFNRINMQGHAVDEVESHLAQIEGQAATVLRDIAQNATLPQNRDMDVLVVFIGILAVNNPQIRDSLINTDQEITRQMMQAAVESREAYESRLSELGIENPIEYEIMKAFVESGNYTINVEDPDGYYLARVFDALDREVLPFFGVMLWSLLIAENEASDFICSDRPVSLFRIVDMMSGPQSPYTTTPAGLIIPNQAPQPGVPWLVNFELTIPLNPRMAIYATTPDNSSPIEYGDKMTVACINGRTIDAAARQIYCESLDFEFLDGETMKTGRDLVDE